MDPLARLHARAATAPESGIVAVMNHGRGLDGVIPLWAGEGDLSTPRFIADAAARSLEAGETFYTWQRGIPELRQALGLYASRLYGQELSPDRFFVTASGMHAIQMAVASLAGEGDEVVHVGPAWPNFAAAVGVAGAVSREVALDWTEGGWRLDIDKLRQALGPRARVLFVNTPSNPTGWTASTDTLRDIMGLVRETDVTLVADEIYSRFHYAGGRAPSFHDVMEADEPVIFVNSFSKNWAMTGWRIGWIEAPPAFGPVIENLMQYSTSGVAAFMQRGAVAALEGGEEFIAAQVERAKQARDIFCEALTATNRVALTPPDGAFYAFFAIDGVEDTRAAAFQLLDDARVGLAPGTAFGPSAPRFMRACFHRRLDQVEAAAGRLADWIRKR
ncbi:pyridoxal phosphate-dependent aminotransferase [Aureimonas leprariae]|uniref:Aminotransferase n=1 Tax=Plantimonas leprariae TaxID=2615207 RepID=A0A7V7PQ54_9HYPH|nr:pyridoxal phosphate-dependent aminotransferase [Aureimonas leprariae]KAB0680210.1 aminotransferase class I/II-fold pyridoxal phosphate-dependent enzyme [Aureimonas leprariae]